MKLDNWFGKGKEKSIFLTRGWFNYAMCLFKTTPPLNFALSHSGVQTSTSLAGRASHPSSSPYLCSRVHFLSFAVSVSSSACTLGPSTCRENVWQSSFRHQRADAHQVCSGGGQEGPGNGRADKPAQLHLHSGQSHFLCCQEGWDC